jgi:hypothetical protein
MFVGLTLFASATIFVVAVAVRAWRTGAINRQGESRLPEIRTLAMAACHSIGRFSNSYIVAEDHVLVFLSVSTIAMTARRALIISTRSFHEQLVIVTVAIVACAICRAGLRGAALAPRIDLEDASVGLLRLCVGNSVPIIMSGLPCLVGLLAPQELPVGGAAETKREFRFAQMFEAVAQALAWCIMAIYGSLQAAAAAQARFRDSGVPLFWAQVRTLLPRFVYALGTAQLLSALASAQRSGGIKNHHLAARLKAVSRVGLAFAPSWAMSLGTTRAWSSAGLMAHVACFVACGFGLGRGLAPGGGTSLKLRGDGAQRVGVTIAVLWRLLSRHHFLASGHGNTFSDLQ